MGGGGVVVSHNHLALHLQNQTMMEMTASQVDNSIFEIRDYFALEGLPEAFPVEPRSARLSLLPLVSRVRRI